MDYIGEQTMELEALEAILMDDLETFDGTLPDGWRAAGKTYKVRIDPEDDADAPSSSDHRQQLMELLFAHTPNYPDEPPCYKLRAVQGLSDADMLKGMEVMHEVVAANLGMAMVYALVAGAKEWLQSRGTASAGGEVDPLLARKAEQDEDERQRAEHRSHGVMCTVETFTAWKASFDAEVLAERQRLLDSGKIDEKSQRLSGKAYFIAQAATALEDEMEGSSGASSEEEDDGDEDENVDYTTAAGGGGRRAGQAGGDEEEEDLDYEDDDDEGLLEEFVPVVVATGSLARGKK